MKKNIFLLLLPAILFTACEQNDIAVFSNKPEVYFEKFYMNAVYPGREQADSTIASFFFYPDGTKNINVPLVMNLSGRTPDSDLSFSLKVIEGATTANATEYTLASSYTFRKKAIPENTLELKDTIFLSMHYSERLAQSPEGVKLTVEIVPNDLVGSGQFERRRAVIMLSTKTVKPDWWTKDVENNLLSTYSNKKYRLFLNEIDKEAQMDANLIVNRPDLAIKLAMQFKAWLTKQVPSIYEEDGSLMKVNI